MQASVANAPLWIGAVMHCKSPKPVAATTHIARAIVALALGKRPAPNHGVERSQTLRRPMAGSAALVTHVGVGGTVPACWVLMEFSL